MPVVRSVVVADDHIAVHAIVRRLLEPEFRVIATVVNGFELMAAAREHEPDVLVVDVAMPGLSGIEALRRLNSEDEARCAVFLTTHSDPQLIDAAFGAGALAYVLKGRAAEDLLPAVRAALEGNTYISSSARRGLGA